MFFLARLNNVHGELYCTTPGEEISSVSAYFTLINVKSRYSIVSKIKRTRYAESFSDTQITSAWCVSDLFAFIPVLQTEFCIFINSGRNSRQHGLSSL